MVDPNTAVAAAEQSIMELAPDRLLHFSLATMPEYIIGKHHAKIAKKLEDVYNGKIKRLMIFVPPRHGKTELASIRFPAWALGKNPNLRFIGTSYGAELADKLNRSIQRIIDSEKYAKIFPDTRLNNGSWEDRGYVRKQNNFEIVKKAGSYRSAGVNGAINGTGADILLIDDPIKNKKEAESQTYRDAVWDWYTSTAYTRLEKDGAIILIQTRWHEDDLAGRLLKQMNEGGDYADQWDVLNLEAIRETKDNPNDWRKMGEALWPWKFPLERLKIIRENVGSRVWDALYQQAPTSLEGGVIKMHWWRYYKEIPMEHGEIVQFWDTAQHAGVTNDYSVCATYKKTSTGYYLLDLWRDKVEAPELERMAVAMFNKWLPNRVVIEDKSSGSSLIQYLRANTAIPVFGVIPCADKILRALDASPTIEAGNVYLPENAPWLAEFLKEHKQFPQSEYKDQVDTTSMAIDFFKKLGNFKPRVRRL